MTTGNSGQPAGLPLAGTAFAHFALDMVDLLKQAEPNGLDQDEFLGRYFKGKPPTDPAVRDAWWEEFKRARDYSNDRFNDNIPPWAFIRARPGLRRGQYFYHVVAQREGDRVKIKADAASLTQLEDFTNRRWETQTGSRQKVRAARGLALIEAGTRSTNQTLINKGEAILNEFITLSPGLAAINFDTGIVMDDLHRLANSQNPRVQLLSRPVKDAVRSGRRFERDVSRVVQGVLVLADIYKKGSMKALP